MVRLRKTEKLVMFMTSPGQADPIKLFKRTVCCFHSPKSALFQLQQSYMRTGHQKSCIYKNSLHAGITAHKPAVNRRQQRKSAGFVKAHSLQKGWTVEKWQKVGFSDESSIELHPSQCKYCRRPVGICMDPILTQKTVMFGWGKIMVHLAETSFKYKTLMQHHLLF